MAELINSKELRKLIVTRSGYFQYEVQDIVDAFTYVVKEQLKLGNEIKLDDLFTFGVYCTKPKKYALNGVTGVSPGKKKVKVTVSGMLTKHINS